MKNDEIQIETIGQFIDYIFSKLTSKKYSNKEECSSQYIFYNLREIISENRIFSREKLSTKTKLDIIFPIIKRKKQILLLEQKIGFKINALTTPLFYNLLLMLTIIVTILSIFINIFSSTFMWSSFLFSSVLICLSNPLTIVFKDKTIGELTKRIERENYIDSQKNKNTYNKKEVEKNITDLFIDYFDLQKSNINRETKL